VNDLHIPDAARVQQEMIGERVGDKFSHHNNPYHVLERIVNFSLLCDDRHSCQQIS
jgi:hypothetical protein